MVIVLGPFVRSKVCKTVGNLNKRKKFLLGFTRKLQTLIYIKFFRKIFVELIFISIDFVLIKTLSQG